MTPDDHVPPSGSGSDSADRLRLQAAACRRLAAAARTRAGRDSLGVLADHLDAQAAKIDPIGEFR